jgi:hypothetical protein
MELYAGLDLHSRNTYIGIMDDAFNRVFKKRVWGLNKPVCFFGILAWRKTWRS